MYSYLIRGRPDERLTPVTAVATEAPDKRLQAGAEPATGTNLDHTLDKGDFKGCPYCAKGYLVIKLKRQWIHRLGSRNIVCPEKGIKLTDL